MDISINWLNSILNLNIKNYNARELDKFLTFHGFNPNHLTVNGFEVEHLYNKKINNIEDIIIEIDTTPNRRDLNSVFGICSELSILLNLGFAKKFFYPTEPNFLKSKHAFSQRIKTIQTDREVFYGQVHNIYFCDSPKWLQNRLATYNIETINIFEDLTNYIQLEWGQTVQFYDLEKIKDFNLRLERSNQKTKFNLSHDEAIFISGCQTISNVEQVLSICGIAENNDICVSKSTKSLLIECITYSRDEIRTNQIDTKLRTPSSIFREKIHTSIQNELVIQRVLKLMSLYWPRIRVKNGPIFVKPKPEKTIHLRYESVRRILGKSQMNRFLTNKEIDICIERLNFPIRKIECNTVSFHIPQLRYFDIDEEIDMIEEIGRMYGFNNFGSERPQFNKIGKITIEQRTINKLRDFSIHRGFYELINYSFSNSNDNLSYRLINPISAGKTMQQSLNSNLIETIKLNLKQQNQLNRGFEIAHIFHKFTNQEATFFSGFISNESHKNNWGKSLEFYSWSNFKDFVTNMMSYVGLDKVDWIPNIEIETKQFHPNRNAILSCGKKTIGLAYQIHPTSAKMNNINGQTYIFELNATLISQILSTPQLKNYKSFSLFPSIHRDMSFTVKNTDLSSRYELFLTEFINKSTTLVRKVYLKDTYEFCKDKKKYKTLTYSFVFQSKFRTLKNEEIESWLQRLELEFNKLDN